MKKHFFETIILLGLVLTFISCASKKKVIYFQNVNDGSEKEIYVNYKTIFEPDDLLAITISSSDMQGLEPFNLPAVSVNAIPGSITGEQKQLAYLVTKEGTINFPVLGEIKIAGLSRVEAIKYLSEQLSVYIKKPIVHIELINFKISVLGEVNKPGTFSIPNERISIIEALGLAGDLTITAQRDEVLVIREIEGKFKYFRIDLTSEGIFNSPVYYLKQNDAIYVAPNKAKIKSASYNKNTPVWVSVGSVIVSLAVLITTQI